MSLEDFIDPQKIITVFGLLGVVAIVFAESGLFFGFFLPGDSLLFTAGLLSSMGHLPLGFLLVGTFVAAALGDSVGYWFGQKTGPALFKREDSRFFKKKYLEDAKIFFDKHGRKTIILARFMPIVRTFAPILAGVANMRYRSFFLFNIVGAFLWSFCLILLGYFLGRTVPDIDRYLLPIVLCIIAISFIPGIIHIFRKKT